VRTRRRWNPLSFRRSVESTEGHRAGQMTPRIPGDRKRQSQQHRHGYKKCGVIITRSRSSRRHPTSTSRDATGHRSRGSLSTAPARARVGAAAPDTPRLRRPFLTQTTAVHRAWDVSSRLRSVGDNYQPTSSDAELGACVDSRIFFFIMFRQVQCGASMLALRWQIR
jgi:hypothetical protein